jgi:hypothetical protein
MERKRPNPLRGPLLTLALMLVSVAAVVAVADAIDAREKAQVPTAAVAAANAPTGQTSVR